jgi:hypothetical protein
MADKTKGLALLMAEKPEAPMEEDVQLTEHPEPDADDAGTYITVPPNFQPPEDKQMGQEFSGTYRGKMMDDGRLCLTAINEIPMKGAETPKEEALEGESESAAEEAAMSPANAQDEGGVESTPEVKESKKLKAMLNGR